MFENFFDDLAEKKKQESRQEIEEFCEKLFAKAKKELLQEMGFLDLAMKGLPCYLEWERECLLTDGKRISCHPVSLYHLYKRSIKLVNRACVHMILHCLFKHLWKQISDEKLWDLSCDIAVEWLMDSSIYSCLATPQSSFRQETYKKLRQEEIRGIAEDIYDAIIRWNLQEGEVTQLTMEYRVDEHEGWRNFNHQSKSPSTVVSMEKKWQEIKENIEREMAYFAGDFDSEAERFLNLLKTETEVYKDYDFEYFLQRFGQVRDVMSLSVESTDYSLHYHGLMEYRDLPPVELQEKESKCKNRDFVVVIDTKAAFAEETIEGFIAQVKTTLAKADSSAMKVQVHILRWNEKSLSWGREDFRPAFTYVEELLKKGSFKNLQGLLYFTDRAGQFPKRVPSFRTAFVFANRENPGVEVPPWAMKVIYQ